ncbi:hypothetical protein U703_09665 [Rhodobacter capsulatus YW1]|nr:hypothetical protein U703_09665 [Rhodobacter capsulatus YW1]
MRRGGLSPDLPPDLTEAIAEVMRHISPATAECIRPSASARPAHGRRWPLSFPGHLIS